MRKLIDVIDILPELAPLLFFIFMLLNGFGFWSYLKQKFKEGVRHTEDVGGVRMWVKRDNVVGSTFYLHPKDQPRPGIVIYIGKLFSSKIQSNYFDFKTSYYLRIDIYGKHKHAQFQDKVLLRIPGTRVEWERGIEAGYVGFEPDSDWYEALKSLPTAKVAVVRFIQEKQGSTNYIDFKVSESNKRRIAHVLKAFEFLVQQESKSASASSSASPATTAAGSQPTPALGEGASTPLPTDTTRPLDIGLFKFMPDGTITDQAGSFQLSRGRRCDVIRLEGDSTLTSPSPGNYVVTLANGERYTLRFVEERWVAASVPPRMSLSYILLRLLVTFLVLVALVVVVAVYFLELPMVPQLLNLPIIKSLTRFLGFG